MNLVNRQYIPGYGNLRVVSDKKEISTIVACGHGVGVYDAIGKFLFLYHGEFILIPYDVLRKEKEE